MQYGFQVNRLDGAGGIRTAIKEDGDAGMSREETVRELVRRMVKFYKPEQIYLFGSVARGEDGPDSDLDFCVVLPDSAEPALLKPGGMRRLILDLPAAVDIFRIRRTEFERRLDWLVSIPAAVRREGRLLYARNASQG